MQYCFSKVYVWRERSWDKLQRIQGWNSESRAVGGEVTALLGHCTRQACWKELLFSLLHRLVNVTRSLAGRLLGLLEKLQALSADSIMLRPIRPWLHFCPRDLVLFRLFTAPRHFRCSRLLCSRWSEARHAVRLLPGSPIWDGLRRLHSAYWMQDSSVQ